MDKLPINWLAGFFFSIKGIIGSSFFVPLQQHQKLNALFKVETRPWLILEIERMDAENGGPWKKLFQILLFFGIFWAVLRFCILIFRVAKSVSSNRRDSAI